MLFQSILDEEAKGDTPKRVFLSGQTTHITIEEEHPGGEDLNPDSNAEDDDFDIDMSSPQSKHAMGMTGLILISLSFLYLKSIFVHSIVYY